MVFDKFYPDMMQDLVCHVLRRPLQTLQLTFIFSLGLVLSKLQGKVVTHSQDLVWWSFLMVECVTILVANWT